MRQPDCCVLVFLVFVAACRRVRYHRYCSNPHQSHSLDPDGSAPTLPANAAKLAQHQWRQLQCNFQVA